MLSPEVISKTEKSMPCFSRQFTWERLMRGTGKKRYGIYPRREKKAHYKKSKEIRRKDGLSIDTRPGSYWNNREEVGHVEIDLVITNKAKGHNYWILTDRKNQNEIIRLIKDKRSETIHESLKELLQKGLSP